MCRKTSSQPTVWLKDYGLGQLWRRGGDWGKSLVSVRLYVEVVARMQNTRPSKRSVVKVFWEMLICKSGLCFDAAKLSPAAAASKHLRISQPRTMMTKA